jgi:hypothetical protein
MTEPIIRAEGFFDLEPKHTGSIAVYPDRVVFERSNLAPRLEKRLVPLGDRQVVFLRGVTTVAIYKGQVATQVVFTAGGLGREGSWLTADHELAVEVYEALVRCVGSV